MIKSKEFIELFKINNSQFHIHKKIISEAWNMWNSTNSHSQINEFLLAFNLNDR